MLVMGLGAEVSEGRAVLHSVLSAGAVMRLGFGVVAVVNWGGGHGKIQVGGGGP